MIRALVVDDCSLAREILADMLAADPGISVVGTACDGFEAVRQACEIEVDVITMDLHMPEMDGIEATRRIMAECPCPIVAVHGDWTAADERDVERALGAGAVGAIEKTIGLGQAELEDLGDRLRRKVREAVRCGQEGSDEQRTGKPHHEEGPVPKEGGHGRGMTGEDRQDDIGSTRHYRRQAHR
ncbi:MAG: response regulator [Lentisphaerae bacterium]|jgi:two-component system, chemotaxis family, protein-glutamate methylesterase/glutaminase|nr:response regulator [Lentisphaerota bacterium]MBT4816335.1 response regulator [Lentisphaerota bacterium]MBT5608846.1 response regulator [Lentisphaerota bacterium]MBT7058740.1 response regulator [Lentisphaerota bacterium]MBT7845053.1 response regulator [Lentisphaerota bacterium]